VVNAGSGSVSTAGVTSVGIVCTENTYTIGGTSSGLLPGRSVVLLNNSGDPLTLTANGSFTLVTRIPFGSKYGVTIGTQPLGEACEVTDGSASVGAMNVTNVSVACVPTAYTIGGTLSGLLPGGSVVLLDNGGGSADTYRGWVLYVCDAASPWKPIQRNRRYPTGNPDLHFDGRLRICRDGRCD
jgi:hypothetical protein